jgi:hypothetical protein
VVGDSPVVSEDGPSLVGAVAVVGPPASVDPPDSLLLASVVDPGIPMGWKHAALACVTSEAASQRVRPRSRGGGSRLGMVGVLDGARAAASEGMGGMGGMTTAEYAASTLSGGSRTAAPPER